MDELVRSRLRALRQHRGWSLHELSRHSGVGASTISRLETGRRSVSFDVLVPLARSLDISIDELVASDQPDDVVIRPEPELHPGMTVWPLTRGNSRMVAVKVRFSPVEHPPEPNIHPGHDWMFVLEGSVVLLLGDRQMPVHAGESAEFSTMTPHAVYTKGRPAEVLMIFDHSGARSHLGA